MIRSFLFSLHRVLGIIICLFLLMWFVTGLVLIYHSFPNVTKEQKYAKMETLPSSLRPVEEIICSVPEKSQTRILNLRQFQGQTLYSLSTKENSYTICADSSETVKPLTYESIEKIATGWIDAPILKVDTLYDLEIWIMYTKYRKELPIYKFYFDDPEKHQLYISSQTGEVQQWTTAKQRFYAWIGSIPHKLYIPALRKHTSIWIDTITVCSLIALFVCLTGCVAGVYRYYHSYKKKGTLTTPYRKTAWKWHHVMGVWFSLFLISWTISGAVSLKKIPQWIAQTHMDYKIPSRIRGKQLSLDSYRSDYREITELHKNVKEIRWSHFQGIPVYQAIIGNKEYFFDASGEQICELELPVTAIEQAIRTIHGDSITYTLQLITAYENYYLPWKRELALPVYKVEVDDPDQSLYYINPQTGEFKYLNTNRKVRKWLFSGLHYFHFKPLTDFPVVWTIVIWFLTGSCIVVTATGTWLSFHYLKRHLKRKS